MKGNAELLSRMDMIVAAGGGERDYAVDAAILSALPKAADPGAYLNEHLLSRPAADVVSGATVQSAGRQHLDRAWRGGSSRTFMGEEASGADAVRIACARIAAGQGESVPGRRLVQRAAARRAAALRDGPAAVEAAVRRRVGAAGRGGGMVLGSLGCFLVIESREHAAARGAAALAHIAAIATDRCRRRPGEATANAERATRGACGIISRRRMRR